MSFQLTRQIKRNADMRLDKMNSLIDREFTRGNVLKFSEEMQITENLAKRYFDKTCLCGEIVNFEDVSMFLRYNGRYADLEQDDRQYLCSKCLAEHLGLTGKEYWMKVYENVYSKCNLF